MYSLILQNSALPGPGKSTALLSAFHNGLSAYRFPPQCYVCVLPAGREGEVSGRKAESLLTLAESRAVGLPRPRSTFCHSAECHGAVYESKAKFRKCVRPNSLLIQLSLI
jgi:hypothetical protein